MLAWTVEHFPGLLSGMWSVLHYYQSLLIVIGVNSVQHIERLQLRQHIEHIEHIERLQLRQQAERPKFKYEHIRLNSFSKMKVALAAQVL